MTRLSELLGFATTTPRPAASDHPNGAAVDSPAGAPEAPASALSSTTPALDPSSAPTVTMAALRASSAHRPVSSVVAPATSRSHVVPSVVAPATNRSTRSAPPVPAPPRVVAAPAPAPAPADGGIFVGSQSPRRPGSLVSRVRRRLAVIDEPGGDSAAAESPVEEAVTVISRIPRRDPAPEAWTPTPIPAPGPKVPAGPDWGSDTRIEMNGAGRAGAPYAGEEPAPGRTVVLEGDDVEAWVRERLYGGRLPTR